LGNVGGNKVTNSLAAGKREHGTGKIEADDLGVRYFVLKRKREIATASGQVKHTSWVPLRNNFG